MKLAGDKLVEMEKPTISCTGKFTVDPTPDEGSIYRMEGETCKAVEQK